MDTPGLTVSDTFYVIDAKREISAVQFYRQLSSGIITERTTIPFDQGLSTSRFWLGFNLHNQGKEVHTLQVATGAAFRPLLNIYLFDQQGQAQVLLEENHSIPFSQRPRQFHHLTSQSFILPADQQATLVIEYETIGASYLPLSLGTPGDIGRMMQDDALSAAFFYSFSIAVLVLFALFGHAMSNRISVLYALLFLLGLLTIAALEGYAFKLLWPHWPAWNHFAPLVLLYALCAFGSWVARASVDESENKKTARNLMLGLALLCAVLLPLVFFVDFIWMAQLANLLILSMFAAHVYAMSSWLTLDGKPNYLAIGTAAVVTMTALVLVLLSQNSNLLPGIFYIQSTRGIYLVIMLATVAVLGTHVRNLHRNHEQALKDALQAAEREASINHALYEAEQNYSRARELANQRRYQLASASHDMRQPLVSLRSTIDSLTQEESTQTREQLNNAFSYLDKLCSQYLDDTHPDTEPQTDQLRAGKTGQREDNDTEEAYPISLVLDTAKNMFIDEAENKNIELRCRPSSQLITTPPMVLMRLYSNLVSNAVKHTSQGRILLGVRRRHAGLSLQVHDTGSGIPASQLETILQAYQKGPDSEGTGLGLAICRQLAEENGLEFNIRSREGRGTSCEITIPG